MQLIVYVATTAGKGGLSALFSFDPPRIGLDFFFIPPGCCEWVGVVDTRDLPLTDFESVNGNLHLQLPLCNTLY